MNEEIYTHKIGGIWHGYLKGDASVDERGLTEEVARRKVEQLVARRRIDAEQSDMGKVAVAIAEGVRLRHERRKRGR